MWMPSSCGWNQHCHYFTYKSLIHPITILLTIIQAYQKPVQNMIHHYFSKNRRKSKNILNEFPTVATHNIGRTTLVTHTIATTELVPICRRAYPCPAARRAAVQENLQFLSEQGFIVPSDAPWAAPLFAVPKKNGQIRLVVDYRQLNKVTVSYPYVFPRIEEIIESNGT